MFYVLLYVTLCPSKRELIALLNLSSWCLMMVERLFLAVPRGCLQFVIVVFPDHTHLLFFIGPIKLCILCRAIHAHAYTVNCTVSNLARFRVTS